MRPRRGVTRVTLKDIATRTGYTANTVSRALKDKEDIGAETRKSIQEIAREMGYISDSIAASLRTGRPAPSPSCLETSPIPTSPSSRGKSS